MRRKLLARAAVTAVLATGVAAGTSGAAEAGTWTGFNSSYYNGGVQRANTWGSIYWADRDTFAIPDLWLKDTSCDSWGSSVQIDVSGLWRGTTRVNDHGCGTSVDFGKVHAEDNNGIRYIGFIVCRTEGPGDVIKQCHETLYWNPNG